MTPHFKVPAFLFLAFFTAFCAIQSGCKIYRFNQRGDIPDSVKTVRIQIFENRAPYNNPQLTPNLADRLRQKINNQTRLSQTNNEDAHWDISGTVTEYSVTTSGITSTNGQSQTSVNRLTVSIAVTVTDARSPDPPKEFTVTRQFDFGATQSLQRAEADLLDEMVRNLTDEIFNRLFSDW